MISLIIVKLKLYRQMFIPFLIFTGMTLLFIYLFGIGFSGDYKPSVYVVDEDQTNLSQRVIDGLKENNKYRIIEDDYESSMSEIAEMDAIGVLYFEKGFADSVINQDGQVYFYKKGDSIEQMSLVKIVQGLINETVRDIAFANKIVDYYGKEGKDIQNEEILDQLKDYRENYKAVSVVSSYYESAGEDFDTIKHYFSGFMLFFSLFLVMFGIGSLVDEKEYHVFDRIKVSPLTTLKIVGASIIVNFMIGMAQLGFVIIVSKYMFNIDLGNNTMALLAVLGMYVVVGTSMGLFITVFVKTQSQLAAILPTFIVSTSMLGGCMWPLEIIDNKVLLMIANFTPQKWAMEGVEQVIINNGSISDVATILGVLLLMTVILTIGTILGYKWIEDSYS